MDETKDVGEMPESDTQTQAAPTETPKKRGRPKGSKNARKPVDLTPDIAVLGERAVSTAPKYFWVGLFPECPQSVVHLAGVSFQKMTERLYDRPGQERKQRMAQVGGIQKIDAEQMERMAEIISRTVVRFFDEPIPVRDDDVELVQTLSESGPVRGHVLKAPTKQQLEEAAEYKRSVRPYRPNPHDRNVAHYLYCVPCADQTRPAGGMHLPDPVSVTGLEWPKD